MRIQTGIISTLLVSAIVAGGCGGGSSSGGKSIDSVSSCLKKISGMKVTAAPGDSDVTKGVEAQSSSTDLSDLVVAAAATAKNSSGLSKFRSSMTDAAKQLKGGTLHSGVKGNYAWVALESSKNAKNFSAVEDCVKP